MRLFIVILLLTASRAAFSDALASSVGLFVYPAEAQTKEKQEQDDYQCFSWAKDETGHDPMTDRKAETVAAKKPGMNGSGVKGALRGAARGAILGEVFDDDAGKGAEIGGTLGVMQGRKKSRANAQQAAASANQNNAAAFSEEQTNFKKAMSICLEARGYSVK